MNEMQANDMQAIDIARRFAQLDYQNEACKAYTLAIADAQKTAEIEWEAALYILQNGGNYLVAYDALRHLHGQEAFHEDAFSVMNEAFYEPNVKMLKNRYEKNCKLLKKYPYLFRRDFPAFEDLPIRFFPYDDERYLPYDVEKETFGQTVNFYHPVISRNFFHDLEKPIFAEDVYSMYELEYLNDNVRRSEDIGRENHIYLHYTNWAEFCAHLQCWNLREILESQKIVFLMEEEKSRYPIDFKAEFGKDYSQYPLKPVSFTEINRLIWHTQLASHNGGDFFNEIFDAHPNLIIVPSIIMDSIQKVFDEIEEAARADQPLTLSGSTPEQKKMAQVFNAELKQKKNRTAKNLFIAYFLTLADLTTLDQNARIAPAIFFQPHFHNLEYTLTVDPKGRGTLSSADYERIKNFPIFTQFKYIKTFTPMRRVTSSVAATIRFMLDSKLQEDENEKKKAVVSDELIGRTLNRSFMVDWQDRLYQDSVLVRFEDGKLNPKATFTALAAFLDLPYTESMTYCSYNGEQNPESMAGNDLGFSTAAIYRTYDKYLGEPERYFLEYFMRDAYMYYGYDFQYYDGKPMDLERANALIEKMDVLDNIIRKSYEKAFRIDAEEQGKTLDTAELEEKLDDVLAKIHKNRSNIAAMLIRGLHFVNQNGEQLNMMPRLQLDSALLEQELYH